MIKRAVEAKRSHLENGTEPQEPQLSEAEKETLKGTSNNQGAIVRARGR